ncbi:hypothetical protein DIURU_001468 [Diutina rugosa]|uniref:Uncharacterized protein n=1 Tax=Diutina rugosa TaxID=5481 RepID=A0A642UTT2_DIURU|nr:uncharacterized protein DIURU_001468 [Diutina rugosa]KAA8905395.1 hypothetical protein DIURU_001468 [Diutina rugosa]
MESYSSPEGSSKDASRFGPQMSRVTADQDFVYLGNQKFYRSDIQRMLVDAYQGDRIHEDAHKPTVAPPRFGNGAVAFGMGTFGITALVSGLFNCNALGVTQHQLMMSVAYFAGGMGLFIAGIWEFAAGGLTFVGTSLVSYGAFWLSYGALYTPSLGIVAAYMAQDPTQLPSAKGFFLVAWAMYSFMNLTLVLRATFAYILLFGSIMFAFIFLAVGSFKNSHTYEIVGGVFSIITGVTGFGVMYAAMAYKTEAYFVPDPMLIPLYGTKPREEDPHLLHLMKEKHRERHPKKIHPY